MLLVEAPGSSDTWRNLASVHTCSNTRFLCVSEALSTAKPTGFAVLQAAMIVMPQ